MKYNDREDVLKYAQQVYLNLNGSHLPVETHASDHPYQGFPVDVIKEMVNGDLVKSQVRDFEKSLKEEMNQMFDTLQVDTPVKVVKGSKDKKGIEGFILYGKEPLQGSGKALFVYDVFTNRNCMVRSSAVKVRLPKPGERDLLKETYYVCKTLAPHFTAGSKVELKSNNGFQQLGVISQSAELNNNLDGHGFYQVSVLWNDGSHSTHILTELNLVK